MLKRIEIIFRKFLNRLYSSGQVQILIDRPIDIFSELNLKKILLLRHDRIGDLIVTTPFLRVLKSEKPHLQIDILLSAKNVAASKSIEKYTGKICVYQKNFLKIISLIKDLRKEKYDLIVDLFDNVSTTSNIILKLLSPKNSIGFKKKENQNYKFLIPLPDKIEVHIIERIMHLLLPFGINPQEHDLSPEYNISDKEKKYAEEIFKAGKNFRVAINLAGSNRDKFWGVENNIKLINMITADFKKFEIYLFGTKEYKNEMDEIINRTLAKQAPITTTFHDYAVLLNKCDILITPDTAAVHLASAWKMPCVVLYTLMDESFGMPWYPYNSPYKALINKKDIKEIAPQEVFTAFKELILVN